MSLNIPDACTLPTAERPLRLAEFDELFATAVRRVEPLTTTHARLHLTGPAGTTDLADRVRDLTARETECCSFFTFTVTPDGDAVILDVEVPAAYAEVLSSLTSRARLHADLAARRREAIAAGAGTPAWAAANRAGVALVEAIAGGSVYHFPSSNLTCDLAADGGDAHERIDVWQRVLARVERREPLPDTIGTAQVGVALRFALDTDLAATLGRLAAAEYRCCSFGSYTIVVDEAGLRLEIRLPEEAADTLAAVVGLP